MHAEHILLNIKSYLFSSCQDYIYLQVSALEVIKGKESVFL